MRRIVLVLLLLLPLVACSVQEKPERTLAAVVPASGMSVLALDVNIGAVSITTSTDAKVHVSIGLKPSNSFFGIFSTGGSGAIKAAAIKQESANGVLKLSVQYPTNTDAGDVGEYWTLAVPAGMHVKSDINVGKLQMNGVAGGLDAKLNIGKVTLDLPGGALKVSMNVGKINARVHTLNYGSVNLGADVGNVDLQVNGASAGNIEKSGSGAHVSYQGHGQDAINLMVSTGKVILALDGK